MRPPKIDVEQAAAEMLDDSDRDGDGALTPEELEHSCGTREHFNKYDLNSDGIVSLDEVEARLRSWVEAGAGVLHVGCLVTVDGKRLADATVRFEPAPFLGDDVSPAEGRTTEKGQCNVSVNPDDMPAALKRVRGVQPGMYLVRITHPRQRIDESYNTSTTLLREIATDTVGPQGIHFDLKSKPRQK